MEIQLHLSKLLTNLNVMMLFALLGGQVVSSAPKLVINTDMNTIFITN